MKENEQKILAVWAHADDAAWTSGGTIALASPHTHIDNVLFTDSNGQGWGNQRLEEERESMKILGMRELYPLGDQYKLEDGSLANKHFDIMVSALFYVLDQAEETGSPYTTLYSFGDSYSGHIDHEVVARVVFEVFRLKSSLRSLWQVGMSAEERALWGDYFRPIPIVDTSKHQKVDIAQTLDRKIDAIKAHKSQLENGGYAHIERIKKLPPTELFNIIHKG